MKQRKKFLKQIKTKIKAREILNTVKFGVSKKMLKIIMNENLLHQMKYQTDGYPVKNIEEK